MLSLPLDAGRVGTRPESSALDTAEDEADTQRRSELGKLEADLVPWWRRDSPDQTMPAAQPRRRNLFMSFV